MRVVVVLVIIVLVVLVALWLAMSNRSGAANPNGMGGMTVASLQR